MREARAGPSALTPSRPLPGTSPGILINSAVCVSLGDHVRPLAQALQSRRLRNRISCNPLIISFSFGKKKKPTKKKIATLIAIVNYYNAVRLKVYLQGYLYKEISQLKSRKCVI